MSLDRRIKCSRKSLTSTNTDKEPAHASYYDSTPVARAWEATPAIGGVGGLLSYPPGLSGDDGLLLPHCRCKQPTHRMSKAPGCQRAGIPQEKVYRCFECLNIHPDQTENYEYQIGKRKRDP